MFLNSGVLSSLWIWRRRLSSCVLLHWFTVKILQQVARLLALVFFIRTAPLTGPQDRFSLFVSYENHRGGCMKECIETFSTPEPSVQNLKLHAGVAKIRPPWHHGACLQLEFKMGDQRHSGKMNAHASRWSDSSVNWGRSSVFPLIQRIFSSGCLTLEKTMTRSAAEIAHRTKFVAMLRMLDLNPKIHFVTQIFFLLKTICDRRIRRL